MKLFLWKCFSKPKEFKSRDCSYLNDDTAEMERLFARIEKIMREKKPFLDGDFSVGDLSQLVFRNKSFVSKTINKMASCNFCTYVNRYRVKYATDIIKSHPLMKKSQVAYMSGFNTVPSFNTAFKNELSMRPSEYPGTDSKRFQQSASRKKAGER